ncbi:MAG: DUF4394 domain-containing protein [Phormidesmis sp. CAN_BIN36]|nr:DUF4394 domain-containing protein [Phormidesmis sp. CAN_BIN36]
MNLQKLGIAIAALIATSVNLLNAAKPASSVTLVGLPGPNYLPPSPPFENSLLLFDSDKPSDVTRVPLTGATTGFLSIDLRPANNLIYGLTSNNVYTVDPFSGATTLVSTLSTPINGGFSPRAIDFDPVVDRLRVIGSVGLQNLQNFSINVDTGAVVADGPPYSYIGLYPAGIAYTNSDTDPATDTALYTVDFPGNRFANRLSVQTPPDAAVQRVGLLGLAAYGAIGDFDIVTVDGVNTAYAAAFDANNYSLFTIDLNTGGATRIGIIGDGRRVVLGLTAAPKAVPEPTMVAGLAIVTAGLVVSRRKPKKNSI